MDLDAFKRELHSAEAMGYLERPAYWQAFRRGLQRAFFGADAVSVAEHGTWLRMLDDPDEDCVERGRGYRDGYAIGLEATGGCE